MKKVILVGAAVAFMAIGNMAYAVPGAALQSVLDGFTVNPAGASSVDVTTDYLVSDEYWSIAGSGGSVKTFVFDGAGFINNRFGIFDSANPLNVVPVFTGVPAIGTMHIVSIQGDGSVIVDFADTGIDFVGNTFGYYLQNDNNEVFYSDTALNTDGMDHMYAYAGTGDIIKLGGNAAGAWSPSEILLAWEDLDAKVSDMDFEDVVVMVESVNNIPDSGLTLALLGVGVLGVASLRRKLS